MRFFVVALVALASIAVLAASSTAATNVLKVKPGTVNFGTKPVGSFTLAPGESCTLVEAFRPSEGFEGLKQDQIWVATATDPESGAILETEEILFLGRAR